MLRPLPVPFQLRHYPVNGQQTALEAVPGRPPHQCHHLHVYVGSLHKAWLTQLTAPITLPEPSGYTDFPVIPVRQADQQGLIYSVQIQPAGSAMRQVADLSTLPGRPNPSSGFQVDPAYYSTLYFLSGKDQDLPLQWPKPFWQPGHFPVDFRQRLQHPD